VAEGPNGWTRWHGYAGGFAGSDTKVYFLNQASNNRAEVRTDAEGRFRGLSVRPGSYQVSLSSLIQVPAGKRPRYLTPTSLQRWQAKGLKIEEAYQSLAPVAVEVPLCGAANVEIAFHPG